ncbi:hypothetical protein HALLA_06655 [Halostagnicola larsenii XH-48]|uniref:DUF8048 domain-containing protein n=1 Tax=Halostagnicola larsenii XH-48 TaxID=797299 RepID=W0JN27_9EURY|nr:hypothetical protein [Halostagnicola larsenii]AHF98574.1 hypothetical protein HALLA_06655 [Halostagnicola larsenii XH-48]
MAGPIEGQMLVLAAAKASVSPTRLPILVARAQQELEATLERYRREYEVVFEDDTRCAFLVERGFWDEIGDRFDWNHREAAAVERAHEEQLQRIGRREDRVEEFEAALEIRDPLIVATTAVESGAESNGSGD